MIRRVDPGVFVVVTDTLEVMGCISAKLFLHRMDCGRFTEKNEHRTSNCSGSDALRQNPFE